MNGYSSAELIGTLGALFAILFLAIGIGWLMRRRSPVPAPAAAGAGGTIGTPAATIQTRWKMYWTEYKILVLFFGSVLVLALFFTLVDKEAYAEYFVLHYFFGILLLFIAGFLLVNKKPMLTLVALLSSLVFLAAGEKIIFRLNTALDPDSVDIEKVEIERVESGPIRFESDEQEIVRSFYKERRTVLTPVGYCFTHAPANKFRVIEEAPSHVILEPIGDDLVIGTFTKIPISSGRCR